MVFTVSLIHRGRVRSFTVMGVISWRFRKVGVASHASAADAFKSVCFEGLQTTAGRLTAEV